MKLQLIHESHAILDQIFTFEVINWLDPEIQLSDASKHFTDAFQTNPPPGISPVNAVASNVKIIDDDNWCTIDLRISLEDFIRNSVEYGEEPYDILTSVKKYAGSEAAKAAYQLLKDPHSGLKVAKFGSDGYFDSYNAKIDL